MYDQFMLVQHQGVNAIKSSHTMHPPPLQPFQLQFKPTTSPVSLNFALVST